MPGQLGLMPILPPSRKNTPGVRGVSGGTNAAKTPRFPMPLDHPSSGLGHVSGGVNAAGRPLAGVSGSVSAPGALKAPHSPTSVSVPSGRGAQITLPIRGVRGGVAAPGKAAHHGGGGFLGEAWGAIEKAAENLYPSAAKPGEKGAKPLGYGRAAATISPIAGGPQNVLKGLGTAAEHIPSNALGLIRGVVPAAKEFVEHPQGTAEKMAKQTGEMIAHPWASFQKEPVTTGLMALGPEEAVGRAVGAGMRAAPSAALKAAASVDRSPLTIYAKDASKSQVNAGLHDVALPRHYSPNIIRKGGQVLMDKYRESVLGRQPGMASGEEANRYLYGGSMIGQHIMPQRFRGMFKPGLIDKSASTSELLRRAYTKAAQEFVHHITPKVGREAVPLFTEGILRRAETVPGDLRKELQRLEDVHPTLTTKRERRLNEANQEQIQALSKDKQFLANPQEAENAARRYADWSRPIEQKLVEYGHLEPDQLRARDVPFVLAHPQLFGGNVRYNTAPGPHPQVDVVAKAKLAVKQAERAWHEAKGKLTSAQAKKLAERGVGGGKIARREAAKQALDDARLAFKDENEKLMGMKHSGYIKNSGEMWPRLEANGEYLPHSQVQKVVNQELRDRQLGFITHKEASYGSALASYVGKRPGTERFRRTGESFDKGAYKRNYDSLRLQAYKNTNALAGHENRDQVLSRFGVGRAHEPDERIKEAYENSPEGKRLEALGPMQWVKIGPERVINRRNTEIRAFGPTVTDHIPSAAGTLKMAEDRPRYTLMHERVVDRINKHDALNNRSSEARAFQWYTNKWRSAALFTSPRWMLGNPQEHAIRLAFQSMSPTNIFGAGRMVHLGKDIINEWRSVAEDPSVSPQLRYAARTHLASYEAGTHYGSIASVAVNRTAENTLNEGDVRAFAEALDESKPGSAVINAWQKWKARVGEGMAKVEKNTKAAMVGKAAINEAGKFNKEWADLLAKQDKAIHDWAMSKLTPNDAVDLGDKVMEMAGNWNQLTPFVRNAVQTFSPFGLWWLTSMKFVFRTLPRDNPLKTATLAAMVAATGQDTKQGALPEFLQGGIGFKLPIVGNVTTTPLYYSPGGVAIEPNVTAASMIAPQATDPLLTMLGINPATHKEITGASPEQLALQSLYSGVGGAIPGVRQLQQLGEQGGKKNYGSISPVGIKKGTARGYLPELIKMLSPIRMTLGPRGGGGRGVEKLKPELLKPEKAEKPEVLKPEKVS